MHHTSSSAYRRPRASWRASVSLVLIAAVLGACALDRSTAPGLATTRPIAKYKEFSATEVKAMFDQARLGRRGWRTLSVMPAPTLTSLGSGLANLSTPDTLTGYIGLSIANTTAEAQGYAFATQHQGAAEVWMSGSGTTQIGIEIPINYDLWCEGWQQGGYWCGDAVQRTVNCFDQYGSNIEGSIENHVVYTTGATGGGTSQDSKDCLDHSGYNGGDERTSGGGGGGGGCMGYIVERSDDGGHTWYQIGAFTICP